MHSPITHNSPEAAFASFDIVSFGTIVVPPHPLRFGFQLDIVPEETPPQIMFGLVSRHNNREGKSRALGFAIQLDLQTGEIWDLLNESGLLGMIPNAELFFSQFSDEEPLLLSWEVEHLGSALIPRLHIGGEEWLYPAIAFRDGMAMDTIAGGAGDRGSTMTAFMHPAVWRETML
jgi:hypothetical protein